MMDRNVFHGRSITRPTTPATATPVTRGPPSQDNVEDEDRDDDGNDDDGNGNGDNEEEASDEDKDGNWDIPEWRQLILLAHLRKAILQDAATLMTESKNDWQCPYGEHHIFQEC
ncbi:hypothetical protein BGX21_007648 [Mortierella sp. AD011]|nr:hypothetical protein BGX20_006714 [Mortierella sp. AD010]KAF9367244.1 hypothetical protein BGX21_007648 [Mortierella sp. AD011]